MKTRPKLTGARVYPRVYGIFSGYLTNPYRDGITQYAEKQCPPRAGRVRTHSVGVPPSVGSSGTVGSGMLLLDAGRRVR